jgi:hypothetical protein
MKKQIMILSLAIISQAATAGIFKKNPNLWQKINEYALTHRPAIIAEGLSVITRTNLGTQAAGYVNDKANNAIKAAGIQMGTPDYSQARNLLTTYGLFGVDEGVKELVARKDAGTLTRIATTDLGAALANFWSISHANLAGRITAKGIGTAVREGVEEVKEFAEKYF